MPYPDTLSYGVTDAKIAVLTADPVGGTTTYGAEVDVPGITRVNIDIGISGKSLRGDNQVLDAASSLGEVEVTVEFAKQSLAVLAAVLGGTVDTTGTTPSQVTTWALTKNSKPRAVRLRAVTAAADPVNGNLALVVNKMTLRGFTGFGAKDDDYTSPSFTAIAVPLLSNGRIFEPAVHETALVLA